MKMMDKVRRMKLREQLSNSEIVRRTGLAARRRTTTLNGHPPS